jgi:hypothetical protein
MGVGVLATQALFGAKLGPLDRLGGARSPVFAIAEPSGAD